MQMSKLVGQNNCVTEKRDCWKNKAGIHFSYIYSYLEANCKVGFHLRSYAYINVFTTTKHNNLCIYQVAIHQWGIIFSPFIPHFVQQFDGHCI